MVKIVACFQVQTWSARAWTPFPLSKRLVRSFGHRKLPEQLLNLSVLKLDVSSFVIHVSDATVADLKQAVEETFNFLREDEGKILCMSLWSTGQLNKDRITDVTSPNNALLNDEDNVNIDHQEKSNKIGDFQDEDAIAKPEFKRFHFLRRWLSQSKYWILTRKP